jgi:hypothetical protein
MKKNFYLLSIILIIFTSCSSDNNDSSNLQEPVLVKEIAVTYNGITNKQKIEYNGNKILSNTWQGGFKTNYTYTGDVITKVEEVDPYGRLTSAIEYKYTNGKIYSFTSINYEFGREYKRLVKYVHNTDGTVSYQEFNINPLTGDEEGEKTTSGKYFYKDGNRVKEEFYVDSVLQYTTIYEFDTKYDNYKNILGYNLLLDLMPSVNNIIKITTIPKSGVTSEAINSFEYNSKGYPVNKRVGIVNGVPFSVVKYSY